MSEGMECPSRGSASFFTQANALLRKNLTFQKRNMKMNCTLVSFPVLLCVLLVVLQNVIDDQLNKPKFRCGCSCIDTNGDGECENVCGIQYSTVDQVGSCPIPSPQEWPALLQVPRPEYRAVKTGDLPSADLPDETCRNTRSCPATILFTGGNRSFAENVASNMFKSASTANATNVLSTPSNFILGTDETTSSTNFVEPAFLSDRPLYAIQSRCPPNFTFSIPINAGTIEQDVNCVQGLNLWRSSPSALNDELYKGFRQGNTERKINEIMAAYDFLNSNVNNYNVRIWYNSTYKGVSATRLVRVSRSLNMVSSAYLRFLVGDGTMMQLEFIKEMPKPATTRTVDISSLLGAVFYNWVIELLFPVILTYLVYEKQRKLRLMMKMHGLGDGPYWVISYSYFLLISSLYMLLFVIFGSLIGLKFFQLNDYSIQLVFYFLYINLQIVLAFLAATFFSDVKTAQAIGYIYIFGSGLLAGFLFTSFVEDTSLSRSWVRVMEIFPAFALYRGLYEFGQYAFLGSYVGTSGMRWMDLNDSTNGMREVLIIMFVEWLALLPVAYYLDQVASVGNRIKNPLFLLKCLQRKIPLSVQRSSLDRQSPKVFVEMEKPDVVQEREVVGRLLAEPSTSHAIICNNLKKVYLGNDGNPDKLAVRGLSLALPHGECFGILGPNGAGKTSFINMMIGLTKPTSGSAYVQGFDIKTDMDRIYTSMGVCPQHDMLWETLTGREHLLFYGRLKNLKGSALSQAVDESLKNVNLFYGSAGDKQAGKYSGGMKRRLSVAISLIGSPKVVFMDEPSTGLDPASRNNLWNVVKRAKQDRAIILTTHSMEEAEVLCDRLGIFVDGSLQCIGNPKQLKGRYGGSYVFTMMTSAEDEEEVERLVRGLTSPAGCANKIYHIAGTQKFEIPKQKVRIADVFRAVEDAKSRLAVQAWGLADTTLEDVFIKVAGATATAASAPLS